MYNYLRFRQHWLRLGALQSKAGGQHLKRLESKTRTAQAVTKQDYLRLESRNK
jgi:hypothetical protein